MAGAGGPQRSGTPGAEEIDPDLQGTKVRVMAGDGSEDHELLPGGPVARPMGWLPDGSGVLLWSRRGGNPGLWMVPVAKGRATGDPKLLRGEMPAGTWPAGIAADGRFFFVEPLQKSDSYIVSLDGGSGRQASPVRLTNKFEGSNGYASWSPDGKKLAWFGFTHAGTTVHIRDVASGREKTLAFPVAPGPFTPRWLEDNRTIIYRSGSTTGNYDMQILRGFDTESGESRVVAENIGGFPSVTGDGSMVYMTTAEGDRFQTVTALNTRTKARRRVATLDGSVFHLAVSPDGRSLACVVLNSSSRRLVLVDIQTGQIREMGATQTRAIPFNRRSIGWTRDGANVLLRTNDGVWAYPVQGGERRLLFKTDGYIGDVALSPDEKSMAYTRATMQHDLWVLENFLPPPK